MGEQAIERLFNSWLDQVPEESKAMLDILALSCEENAAKDFSVGDANRENSKANEYLIRKRTTINSEDSAEAIKRLFTELVATGMSPNEAAAEAIKRSTHQSFVLTEGILEGSNNNDSFATAALSIKNAAQQQ
jgi:hypothetical protein